MNYHQENTFLDENVVKVNRSPEFTNHAVETKDDVCCDQQAFTHTNASSDREGRLLLLESEAENKRSKIPVFQGFMASEQSKFIQDMFYKTKLCYKFRIGTCPYVANCNFAHNYEELREPPPNWQEIVIAYREEQAASLQLNKKFYIPFQTEECYATPPCRMFFTSEGCPYGKKCKFLHDDESGARESEAICLLPGTDDGFGCNGNKSALDHSNWKTNHRDKSNSNPSKWKTSLCYRWERNGYCFYGSKCHFAHGPAELRLDVGQHEDQEAKIQSAFDTTQGSEIAKSSGIFAPGVSGGPSRSVMQKTG